MRIKLKAGKQKELILLAKGNLTWKKAAKILEINESYLYYDLKNEVILLSQSLYKKLCEVTGKNYDEHIESTLDDNWGKIKGGTESRGKGSTINIKIPGKSEKLAELIGIILGDGNINYYKKGKKIGVYQINIAGDKNLDKDYHLNYVTPLFKELFEVKVKERLSKIGNGRYLVISSKQLVNFLISSGLKPGSKIKNQSTIPIWVWGNKNFLRVCLRGLIDTDGSIFRMSKRDYNLIRINFTNHNFTLLNDSRKAFLELGYHPSKIINNRQFHLSRQNEIKEYLKEIGFKNAKHIRRLNNFSPIV